FPERKLACTTASCRRILLSRTGQDSIPEDPAGSQPLVRWRIGRLAGVALLVGTEAGGRAGSAAAGFVAVAERKAASAAARALPMRGGRNGLSIGSPVGGRKRRSGRIGEDRRNAPCLEPHRRRHGRAASWKRVARENRETCLRL